MARHGRIADALALDSPVFVTGLARAGTTILMRLLHGADEFAALSYRDLPFPLAPNGWARVSGKWKRGVEAQERGHGDGLTHDLDSPEAIEEVFWRAREGARYCRPEGLLPAPPEAESIAAFARYVRLVCLRYERTRYLSKNNNNVLRLPALIAAFPEARLVHPFRDPFDQAASLLAQHRRARSLAARDRFRGEFMRWLGHHEFGAYQRPFLLPGAPTADDDPDTLDYWLKAWISVHRHLLNQPRQVMAAQVFVDYDRLKTGDAATLAALGDRLALPHPIDTSRLYDPAPRQGVHEVDLWLADAARALHSALVKEAVA
ncbi:sulfotransferase [Sphingomonas sp.]|uniref:sulfotransferase n=1 Tax=Sphingomonas sp. TaxID=28214 RepID=UPI001B1F6D59|nr:sulfotransferase [Sphingomonas sp.]MBO9713616.1 sulfotransferase [Sphingomonas sp.]